MFHLFHKYSKVCEDGYQYCNICGKAKVPPCIHKWELKSTFEVTETLGEKKWNKGHVYLYECSRCKDTKKVACTSLEFLGY